MATRRPLAGGKAAQDADQSTAWMVLTIALATAATLMAAQLPGALLLPAMSLLMVFSGLSLAAGGWLVRGRMGRDPALVWEIAGALVFFGFAAAMLTDKADALAAFAELEAQALAALSR
jgi:hypothetical protein